MLPWSSVKSLNILHPDPVRIEREICALGSRLSNRPDSRAAPAKQRPSSSAPVTESPQPPSSANGCPPQGCGPGVALCGTCAPGQRSAIGYFGWITWGVLPRNPIGAIAQLVEHLHGMQGVRSSSLLGSIPTAANQPGSPWLAAVNHGLVGWCMGRRLSANSSPETMRGQSPTQL